MPAAARRRLLLALSFAALWAAPATAATDPVVGPGRTVLVQTATAPGPQADTAGASTGVVLPDGSAVLVGADRGRGLVLARVRGDGTPDLAFGVGGVARVALPSRDVTVLEILRRPDGGLLVAVAGAREPARLQVVGLTAAGALDTAFGRSGVAETGLRAGCTGCEPMALQPDGGVAVVGDRSAGEGVQAVVTRLAPDGAPDGTFGTGGTAAIPGASGGASHGLALAGRGDGRLVVLAAAQGGDLVAGLAADGSADGAFASGGAAELGDQRAYELLVHPDDTVDVLGAGSIARLRATGERDPLFGRAGVSALEVASPFLPPVHLLAGADGSVLLARSGSHDPHLPGDPSIVVGRVTRTGASRALGAPSLGFGGGVGSRGRSTRLTLGGVAQDSFQLGRLLARPGGGFLAVGGTRLLRYTAAGTGTSRGFFAVAGLTPSLAPDPAFGGPIRPATARVTVLAQRAALDARQRRIRVRVRASGPGLVLLRVRDTAGRVLAQVVATVHGRRATTVRVPLTAEGRTLLARGRRTPVIVGHEIRDVVGGTSAGSTSGTLR